MRFWRAFIAVMMCVPQGALATDVESESSESFSQMMWEDFKSPITTDAKDTLYPMVGLTTALAIFKDDIGDPLLDDVSRDKPLGETELWDYAGQMIPNAAYTIGMFFSGHRDNAW